MRQYRAGWIVFLVLALSVTGCAKKSTDQASLSGTGFDSLSTSEELAQLPQVSNTTQQTALEVLPIETSPVTPVAILPAEPLNLASTSGAGMETAFATTGTLTHEQQIQTALKNAGYYNGAIDGKIGPASKRAIEAFQKSKSLKVDGKVGPITWAALEPYLSGQTAAGADSQ